MSAGQTTSSSSLDHDQQSDIWLGLAAADIDIAVAAIADMVEFLKVGARPWFEADGLAVSSEPTVVHEAGVLAVTLAAAQASLAIAQDAAKQGLPDAELAIAQARGLAGTVAAAAASLLFSAGGTSAADDPRDFGSHWQAARKNARSNPVGDAFIAAGKVLLAGSPAAHVPPIADRDIFPAISSFAEATERAHRLASALKLTAIERDRTRDARLALDLFASSGLLGVTVPSAFGGLELSYGDSMELSRIISYGDSSIGQISTIHFAQVELLKRVGTPIQRETWFPQVLNGARIGNAAAERGVKHAKITATILQPAPDGGYRLNGRKFYSTGAPGAAVVAVLAVDHDGKPISVLVPRDADGLTILNDWDSLGQRATGSGTTILDDIYIPATDVLPRWLNAEQPGVGTASANLAHVGIDLGIAEAALEEAILLLQLHQVAIEDTSSLHRLGELSAKLHASQRLFQDAISRLNVLSEAELTEDITQALSLQVSIVKVHAGELAVEVGQALLDLADRYAPDGAPGLDRHWRNARTHTLHDPSRWRYLRAGDFLLNGRLPPRNRSS